MSIPKEGRFVWHELMSTDVAKAEEFYTSLFGWTVNAQDEMRKLVDLGVDGIMTDYPNRLFAVDPPRSE